MMKQVRRETLLRHHSNGRPRLGRDACYGWWTIGLRVADTVAANVSGGECSHDQN